MSDAKLVMQNQNLAGGNFSPLILTIERPLLTGAINHFGDPKLGEIGGLFSMSHNRQESRAVAGKPRDAAVNFDRYGFHDSAILCKG